MGMIALKVSGQHRRSCWARQICKGYYVFGEMAVVLRVLGPTIHDMYVSSKVWFIDQSVKNEALLSNYFLSIIELQLSEYFFN